MGSVLQDDCFPAFSWAVGEEGSDPTVSVDGGPFRHDQFAQSGHYENLEEDLRVVASLGVKVLRYGMPWRLTELDPGRYDWTRWDRALAACADAGVEPIVDLLHFGLPDHYPGFMDGAWVDGFCRYVDAFLARYREPRWFTPVNEPGITALLSARLGLWNDQLASTADHARVLVYVVRANLEAIARIRADRGGWWIGAEGFDVPIATEPQHRDEVERRRAIDWLVWDLHLGREPLGAAARYLDPVDDDQLERVRSLAVTDGLIAGLDFYPTSVHPHDGPAPAWSVDERVAFGIEEMRRWHDRYQVPFWVAETSNLSLPVDAQIPWLESLANGLGRLRIEGRPARGLCWYSRGDQFDWQTALTAPTGAVTPVGLFDGDRRARPVAGAFAELVNADGA